MNLKNFFFWLFMLADMISSRFGSKKIRSKNLSFKKIFYRSEGNELLGNWSRNFWKVYMFFFIAILAIGFAKDSLRYLEEQMASPFVRHITADVDRGLDGLNEAYFFYKTSPELAQQYLYSSIYEFSVFAENIKGLIRPAFGRTIIHNDPLIDVIIDPVNNNGIGHGFRSYPEFSIADSTNYGIIVTHDLLRIIGHSIIEAPPFLFLDRGGIIPILAIVKDLPDNKDIVTSPFYYDIVREDSRTFFGLNENSNRLFMILDIDTAHQQMVREAFQQLIPEINQYSGEFGSIEEIYVRSYTKSFRPVILVQLNLSNTISPAALGQLFQLCKNHPRMQQLLNDYAKGQASIVQFYNPERPTPLGRRQGRRQAIGITFDDLRFVRQFSENFERDTQIKLEMSRIYQLENYNFVTTLTLVISGVLIIFSFISISLSVRNMISNHLNKIKMNIGTYKAFGIEISGIYNRMVFVFILVSQLIALLSCYILAQSGLIFYGIRLFNKSISDGYKFFYIASLDTILILVFMFILIFISSYLIVIKLFRNSPGNLVYDRSEQQ